jgi:Fur family transcriptional regulator, ferric uptake regulator
MTSTRSTRQKRAIREVFERLNRPLGPQEVLDAVSNQVEGIGIATVYRNVKSLVEEGWLATVELPGEPARYERAGKGHHHHFRCDHCGSVFELDGCVGNFKALAPPGFRVTNHEVILFGSCAGCATLPKA